MEGNISGAEKTAGGDLVEANDAPLVDNDDGIEPLQFPIAGRSKTEQMEIDCAREKLELESHGWDYEYLVDHYYSADDRWIPFVRVTKLENIRAGKNYTAVYAESRRLPLPRKIRSLTAPKHHCSACGKTGHNRRTCLEKHSDANLIQSRLKGKRAGSIRKTGRVVL